MTAIATIGPNAQKILTRGWVGTKASILANVQGVDAGEIDWAGANLFQKIISDHAAEARMMVAEDEEDAVYKRLHIYLEKTLEVVSDSIAEKISSQYDKYCAACACGADLMFNLNN